MPKFRKRPVVVDAVQWRGNNEKEIEEFIKPLHASMQDKDSGQLAIVDFRQSGYVMLEMNDYIARESDGHLRTYPELSFNADHEPIEDTQ